LSTKPTPFKELLCGGERSVTVARRSPGIKNPSADIFISLNHRAARVSTGKLYKFQKTIFLCISRLCGIDIPPGIVLYDCALRRETFGLDDSFFGGYRY
jgi:hypothetical protein